MFVGALRAEYEVPGARNLKDKRRRVRSLKDRVASRFGVDVAEVDAQDLWQRTVLGVALVSGTESQLRARMDALVRFLTMDPNLRVLGITPRVFERVDPDLTALS